MVYGSDRFEQDFEPSRSITVYFTVSLYYNRFSDMHTCVSCLLYCIILKVTRVACIRSDAFADASKPCGVDSYRCCCGYWSYRSFQNKAADIPIGISGGASWPRCSLAVIRLRHRRSRLGAPDIEKFDFDENDHCLLVGVLSCWLDVVVASFEPFGLGVPPFPIGGRRFCGSRHWRYSRCSGYLRWRWLPHPIQRKKRRNGWT